MLCFDDHDLANATTHARTHGRSESPGHDWPLTGQPPPGGASHQCRPGAAGHPLESPHLPAHPGAASRAGSAGPARTGQPPRPARSLPGDAAAVVARCRAGRAVADAGASRGIGAPSGGAPLRLAAPSMQHTGGQVPHGAAARLSGCRCSARAGRPQPGWPRDHDHGRRRGPATTREQAGPRPGSAPWAATGGRDQASTR